MFSHGEFISRTDRFRVKRDRFDWQIPEPTQHPTTTTTTTAATTTTAEPIVVEKINVTSMIITNGTVQINADDIMHKEEAEGIGDVGLILWGAPSKPSHKATHKKTPTTESNIAKIMNSMPSANEDMIRIVKLAKDEHYGKGKAKPKYISMILAKMNSTEYKGDGSTAKTPTSTTTTTTSTSIPVSVQVQEISTVLPTEVNVIPNTTNDSKLSSTSTSTTEAVHVVMKITKSSHSTVKIDNSKESTSAIPIATESHVKVDATETSNDSSTPIIMGEHMEFSISASS